MKMARKVIFFPSLNPKNEYCMSFDFIYFIDLIISEVLSYETIKRFEIDIILKWINDDQCSRKCSQIEDK